MLYCFLPAHASSREIPVITIDDIRAMLRAYGNQEFVNSGWTMALVSYRDQDGLIQYIDVRPISRTDAPSLPFDDEPPLRLVR